MEIRQDVADLWMKIVLKGDVVFDGRICRFVIDGKCYGVIGGY